MLENPIYNPNSQTGVKGQNTGLKTLQYQFVKLLRAVAKGAELVFGALLKQIVDVVKELFKPGSSSRY